MTVTPVVVEAWTVIDHWWADDGGTRIEYADVDWAGRRIVFSRTVGTVGPPVGCRVVPDLVWRIREAG